VIAEYQNVVVEADERIQAAVNAAAAKKAETKLAFEALARERSTALRTGPSRQAASRPKRKKRRRDIDDSEDEEEEES
jgi:hypothetical protein